MNRKKTTVVVVAVALAFFFVPVVPMNVISHFLLPLRNTCGGIVPEWASTQVLASVSYALFGLVISHTVNYGGFGLVYVPNNGGYSIQFPPLGFESIMCG